jgi:hypothetical protein
MELLTVILDFVAKISYPLVLGLLLILFRKQFAGIFEVLRGILKEIESGRKNVSYGELALTTAAQLQKEDLGSAARIIQKLLSPAAPLALGYVDNFVRSFKKTDAGGISLEVAGEASSAEYEIVRNFTIYIPRRITDIESSSRDLVRDKFPESEIKNISIQSTGGRPFTGLAVLKNGRIHPVDVPKTLTSIRLVFSFREQQLKVEGGMGMREIERLENENLDEFAGIIEGKIKSEKMTGLVRVIRDRDELFSVANDSR